jgi:hypothetical protein
MGTSKSGKALTVIERASSSSRFSAQTTLPLLSLPHTLRRRASTSTSRFSAQTLLPLES